jgi:hypothetical protein
LLLLIDPATQRRRTALFRIIVIVVKVVACSGNGTPLAGRA